MPRASEEKARGFRYQERSKDSVKQRANARGGNFDSIFKPQYKMYKIKDGKNLIRILPPTWDGADHYGYDLYINYNVGADNQSYLSLHKMKNEKDPLYEAKRLAEREGDKATAKALQPRQRILMWVIDRNDEDEGPQLFSCPFTLDKAIANLSYDEDTKEAVMLDHPEKGRDVRFFKEGTGLKTDYDASKIRILNPAPIHEDRAVEDEWLEFVQANQLPDTIQFYDYEHINGVFGGEVGSRDDDDADKAPRSRRVDVPDEERPSRKRTPVEDEPEPPPVRSARNTVLRDEVDTEDDPPFKPTRTRGRVVDADDDAEPEPRREKAEPAQQARPSLRERLQSRRQREEVDED